MTATGALDLLELRHRVGERRLAGLELLDHRLVVLGRRVCGLVEGVVVDHDRAKHRPLGFEVVRQSTIDGD